MSLSRVVVFSQWRRMLELAAWSVSDLLATEGLRALFFTGQERTRRRTQNLVDFHDDPQAVVLFLSDAGGAGLNLQKAVNACINLELPWNPAVLEQRIGRIHRLGQKRPIDVYNLVSRACIEERIAGIVAGGRALFRDLPSSAFGEGQSPSFMGDSRSRGGTPGYRGHIVDRLGVIGQVWKSCISSLWHEFVDGRMSKRTAHSCDPN